MVLEAHHPLNYRPKIYDSPFSSCPGSCMLCTARRKIRKISICSKLNRFICRMRGDWRSSSIIRSLIRLKFKMRTIDIWLYERGDRIMETDAKVELLIVLWHFRSRLMVQLTHIWDYRGNAAQLMFIHGRSRRKNVLRKKDQWRVHWMLGILVSWTVDYWMVGSVTRYLLIVIIIN